MARCPFSLPSFRCNLFLGEDQTEPLCGCLLSRNQFPKTSFQRPSLTPPSMCVFGKLLNISGARLRICRVKIVRVLIAQGGRSWEGAHKKRWCVHSTILAPVSKACIPTARPCSVQSRKVIRWRGHGRCSVAPAVPSRGSSAHARKSLEIFPTFFMPGLCTSLPCTMSIVPSCSQLGTAELGRLLEASLTLTSCMKSFRVLQPKAISRSRKPVALHQPISWG